MTKLELKYWRQAVWWAADEVYTTGDGLQTVFMDLWFGALNDEGRS